MLSNRRSPDRTSVPNATSNLGAVNRLEGALAHLPAPWRVLRNRRTHAADGPPWVKFIVLHPGKGIALVDLFPVRPEAAIAPLDEFLARTGFAAFSRGDPPIVALTLDKPDFASLEDRLADAFASAPPCGIGNSDWTEAVIELLMSTPSLLLTALTRTEERASEERNLSRVARAASPPEPERPPAKSPPSIEEANLRNPRVPAPRPGKDRIPQDLRIEPASHASLPVRGNFPADLPPLSSLPLAPEPRIEPAKPPAASGSAQHLLFPERGNFPEKLPPLSDLPPVHEPRSRPARQPLEQSLLREGGNFPADLPPLSDPPAQEHRPSRQQSAPGPEIKIAASKPRPTPRTSPAVSAHLARVTGRDRPPIKSTPSSDRSPPQKPRQSAAEKPKSPASPRTRPGETAKTMRIEPDVPYSRPAEPRSIAPWIFVGFLAIAAAAGYWLYQGTMNSPTSVAANTSAAPKPVTEPSTPTPPTIASASPAIPTEAAPVHAGPGNVATTPPTSSESDRAAAAGAQANIVPRPETSPTRSKSEVTSLPQSAPLAANTIPPARANRKSSPPRDPPVEEARLRSLDAGAGSQSPGRIPKLQRMARPAQPEPEETVTIDGTTYISGREPKTLGTVTGLPAEPDIVEPEPSP